MEDDIFEPLRGRFGFIKDYAVLFRDNTVIILKDKKVITRRTVSGFQEFLQQAKNIKLGWAELPDFEVIYIYDKADDNFGYAVNLQDGQLSEWGYAPFPVVRTNE